MKIDLNTPRWKGTFDLDLEGEPLTALEWRWIKKISGYLPLTVEDGMAGMDPDLFVALTVIALVRSGRVQRPEALLVADALAEFPADGSVIRFDLDEVEADADDPPAEPAETPATEQPLRSIGGSSSSTSDPLAPGPRITGALG